MKALTLTQPWATLVITGVKRWETRSWYPPVGQRGGHLLIHAAKAWARDDREFALDLFERGVLTVRPSELPLGMILGTVAFTGLVRTRTALAAGYITAVEFELGDYSDGRYAWEFADPRPLPEPMAWRGALGLWNGPDPS